jgi:hypothetical protein
LFEPHIECNDAADDQASLEVRAVRENVRNAGVWPWVFPGILTEAELKVGWLVSAAEP